MDISGERRRQPSLRLEVLPHEGGIAGVYDVSLRSHTLKEAISWPRELSVRSLSS
ncbi:hypothetical protein LCGC14_1981040, partial [marine sediment metagenome]